MKLHNKELYLSISCFFLAFLLAIVWNTKKEEAFAARIAPEIIRFHILAESDKPEDQALKLQLRSYFLDSLYQELGRSPSREDTLEYINENIANLEQLSEQFMASQGYDYSATVEVCQDYFPTKTYGDFTFPRGTYDAVRVTIGQGKGHNWWCVLYPQLCFTEATYAVVPEDSQKQLELALGQQDYDALLQNQTNTNRPQRKIRLRLLEGFK